MAIFPASVRVLHRGVVSIFGLMFLLLVNCNAFAAPPHCTVQGATLDEEFGSSIDSLGDVNADGIGDLVVGAPIYSGAYQYSGRVYVISGADCSVIRTHEGSWARAFLGGKVRKLGDVTGDGVTEYMTTHNGGLDTLKVFSGSNGALVYTIQFNSGSSNPPSSAPTSSTMDDVGDVNNDGIPDIGISSSFSAKLFSGSTGTLIDEMYRTEYRQLAPLIRGIQDYDGDGKRDYIFHGVLFGLGGNSDSQIGIASSNPSLNELAPPYGGICPADLSVGACAAPSLNNGEFFVTTVSDLNHDGFDDFAYTTNGYPTTLSTLVVRSGRYPHKPFFRISGSIVGDAIGFCTSSGQDYDHDGVPEILACGGTLVSEMPVYYLKVLSGSDGSSIFEYFSEGVGVEYSFGAVQMSDVTGDGVGDIAINSPSYGTTQLSGGGHVHRGRVQIITGPREGAELGGDEYFNIGGTVVAL